jgi:hypothetical protein
MEFQYFQPAKILVPYIRHYYLFESSEPVGYEDTVFPSGDMEVIFNLGNGIWESYRQGHYKKNPAIELWGQITRPLQIRSAGAHSMLGVRFFPHATSFLLDDEIGIFNDQVSDLSDVLGRNIRDLHIQLADSNSINARVALLDAFFTERLTRAPKKVQRLHKVAHILSSITQGATEKRTTSVALQIRTASQAATCINWFTGTRAFHQSHSTRSTVSKQALN